jgi:hypothetical protein
MKDLSFRGCGRELVERLAKWGGQPVFDEVIEAGVKRLHRQVVGRAVRTLPMRLP